MTLPEPPKLDARTYDDLVDQVETLVESTTAWQRAAPDEDLDFGGALIRIFSRMMERTISRLNRVPEKNFLAFLDLIGTQIQPPKAARVPLTAKGRTESIVVPAGTRTAATLNAGETEDVLFETEHPLVITPIRIITLFVKDPKNDRQKNIAKVAHTIHPEGIEIFRGDELIDHSLYVESSIFGLPDKKTVKLTFEGLTDEQSQELTLSLNYWDDNRVDWVEIAAKRGTENNSIWLLDFYQRLPAQPVSHSNGREWIEHWLQIKLKTPLNEEPLTVKSIQLSSLLQETQIAPDIVFQNDIELALDKPFLPFGSQPKFNDTFYLAHHTAFAQPGSEITLNISVVGIEGGLITPRNYR